MVTNSRKKLGSDLKTVFQAVDFGEDSLESSQELKTVMTYQLLPGEYQPRRRFDQSSLQELSSSIKSQGILQPIVVRERESDSYEIIAGERRWRAAQMAGLQQVPIIVKNINDDVAMAFGLIENIQRENLNAIEEAVAYKRLIDEFELKHDEVAEKVGKPRTTVSNFLRLLRLDSTVQQWLIERRINMGHAKVLLTLDDGDQIRVGEMIIGRQLSVRQTEDLVRKHNREDRKKTPIIDLELLEKVDQVKHDLSQFIGRRVDVKLKNTNKEKGYLKLPFNSLGELSDLFKYLHQSKAAEEGNNDI